MSVISGMRNNTESSRLSGDRTHRERMERGA